MKESSGQDYCFSLLHVQHYPHFTCNVNTAQWCVSLTHSDCLYFLHNHSSRSPGGRGNCTEWRNVWLYPHQSCCATSPQTESQVLFILAMFADGGCDAYFGTYPQTDNINVPMYSYIGQQWKQQGQFLTNNIWMKMPYITQVFLVCTFHNYTRSTLSSTNFLYVQLFCISKNCLGKHTYSLKIYVCLSKYLVSTIVKLRYTIKSYFNIKMWVMLQTNVSANFCYLHTEQTWCVSGCIIFTLSSDLFLVSLEALNPLLCSPNSL